MPHQFSVRSLLHQPAAVDDEDHVRGQDRRQPVGDGDGGAPAHQRLQGRLHQAFAGGVQRGGGLVEDEHARRLEHHPCDGQALLLAPGHAVAALADQRVVAGFQLHDAVVDEGRARGGLQLRLGRVGLCVQQVAAHGRVEQVGLLRDHGDHVRDRVDGDVAHVVAVDQHRAAGDVVQARDQVRDGRLAGAARADDGRQLSGTHLQGHVVDRPCPRCFPVSAVGA